MRGCGAAASLCGISLLGLALAGCKAKSEPSIQPHIVLGATQIHEKKAVEYWVAETLSLLQSPEFETNFLRASALYPDVYISDSEGLIPSEKLLDRLKTKHRWPKTLWWSKTRISLSGNKAVRETDRSGLGFSAKSIAKTRPILRRRYGDITGEIELGRLHFARYVYGDPVEKSCALNTMAHEISHTLSDKKNKFQMHITDLQKPTAQSSGVYEAGTFIGLVTQCTYLESISRIRKADFETCLLTFSSSGSIPHFNSPACDDFPKSKPVTPAGRLVIMP